MQSASHLSRRRRAALPVLPALLALLLSAVLPAAPARAGGYTPDPVVAELTRAASALASGEPMDTLGDLRPLGRAVDGAVIVGVGEATHGSHQFFALQERVFRYLAEEKGFTALAREAGWDAGLRINEWLLTGRGDIRRIMREVFQSEDRLWNNQEYLHLFEWMRAHNARGGRPLQFVGDDIVPVEPRLYDRVLRYVDLRLPELRARFAELYRDRPTGEVLTATREFRNRPQDERLDMARRTRQAYELLRSQAPDGDREEFDWTVQHARVIAQSARFYAFDNATEATQQDLYRDEQMAANLTWWYEHTGSKTVLAAHDGHVALVSNSPDYPRPQGAFLRDRFGAGYLSVRTSFGEGSFVAYDGLSTQETLPLGTFTTGPPEPGTNEYTLDLVPHPVYLLDLRTVREPARQWLTALRPTTEIGTVWPAPEADTSLLMSSDLLVHFHHVDAARLLPAEGRGAPDAECRVAT
ncbi:erythromycin esterase family protein [Streptomyces albogriseolus]|uniref:erythromycin esterase family protein n=1 Tax=Streptomyces albogriseolus TaxID=1887 RepID=UPI003CE9E987